MARLGPYCLGMTRQQTSIPIPSYEGRALPRPDEEVVDQGLTFDIGTRFDRRRVLQIFGVGAAWGAGGLRGVAVRPVVDRRIDRDLHGHPRQRNRSDRDTGRDCRPLPGRRLQRARRAGAGRPLDLRRRSFGGASGTAEGIPMTLTLTILDIAAGGTPMTGAAVYVWHCAIGPASTRCTRTRSSTRTTCAASRSPTTRARSASPASSRPATPGDGRTSTSRSTPTRPASPIPPRRSPPRSGPPAERLRRRLRHHRVRAVGQQPLGAVTRVCVPAFNLSNT